MKVYEIFTSIQGESSYMGMPCTFIRFSGCNLRCSYCDTEYALEGGEEMSEDEIINEVLMMGIRLVELTGGEPLLQDGINHLIERIINEGHNLLIETNGTMSIKDVDPRANIIMDVKTPGSGMAEETDILNLDFLKPTDELKFVLVDKTDYKWAKQFIKKYSLLQRCRVLLSPAFGKLNPETLSVWMIQDKLDARLNVQLHKYIFGADVETPPRSR